jgi:hypothetical protein
MAGKALSHSLPPLGNELPKMMLGLEGDLLGFWIPDEGAKAFLIELMVAHQWDASAVLMQPLNDSAQVEEMSACVLPALLS